MATAMVETNPDMSGADSGDEMQDMVFAQRGCCHWMPCFSSERSRSCGGSSWERITMNASPAEKEEDGWLSNALKKVREWSELVAGPRWKTFIRRFNRNRTGKSGGKFQYDPLSYARNFDDGPVEDDHFDDDRVYRDFSSRYAAIP